VNQAAVEDPQEFVRLNIREGIATVELNRPASGNAIHLDLARALLEAVRQASHRADVRMLVLRGAGRNFCVGGDIQAMEEAEAPTAYIGELATTIGDAVRELTMLAKPVVCIVQGAAAGAGLALTLAADIVIASSSARFLAAFGSVGLTPDSGTSWLLPQLVGLRRALDLTLTGRVLSAQEALDWGLITRVIDAEALDSHSELTISELASGATQALGATRALVRVASSHTLDEQLRLEALTIANASGSAEAQALLSAFVAKRRGSA
jgi:2-(1,2-epoxy-1,2-dihydrophenyl)acetyl-CoA isomerase